MADVATQKKSTQDVAPPQQAQADAAQAGGQQQKHGLLAAGDAALHRMAAGAHNLGDKIEDGAEHLGTKVKDGAMNAGGEAIGLAEMVGLKYPVKSYEAKVSDQLYRGARVDAQGMAGLKQQGITGIVNLCAENNMDAQPAAQLGMKALHIPIIDNTAPSRGQVQQFLNFVKGNGGPVYVHCEAGQGRTGTMCASYRMAVEGWSAKQAIDEAKSYGLAMPCQIAFLEEFGASLSGAPAVDEKQAGAAAAGGDPQK